MIEKSLVDPFLDAEWAGWDPIDEAHARRQLASLTPPCAVWAPQPDGSLVLTRVEEDL